MSWQNVRPVALAVVQRDEEVLLAEHHDLDEDYWFYRPLGGAIEFASTVARSSFGSLKKNST